MNRRFVFLVLLLPLAGCFGGGGDVPELASVSGRVTLDKEPLPNASVQFTPIEGGRGGVAMTDDSGYYELQYSPGNEGTPPGKYKISISSASSKTDPETGDDIPIPEKVPAKYNTNTVLEEEVVAGSNELNFNLDSEGEISTYTEDEDE